MSIAAEFGPDTDTVQETGLPYISAGVGQPVVLLHGWGGFKEMWWTTMRVLSPSYHIVAFDWPGHGCPTRVSGQPVLETLPRLTVDSCRALGISPVVLVGHSLGGNVAARVALEDPALVSRLVLVNAAIDAEYLSPSSRLGIHPRIGRHLLRLSRGVASPLSWLGRHVPHAHGGGFLLPLARRQRYQSRVEIPVLFEYLSALHQGSIGDQVRSIQQPTLVVVGKKDPLVAPMQAYELAHRIPNAQLRRIQGAMHCPMDERSVVFNRILLDFLKSQPRGQD